MQKDELMAYVGNMVRIHFKPYESWTLEDVLEYDYDREVFYINPITFLADDVDEIEEI